MADDLNDRIRDLDPALGEACDEHDREHELAALRAEVARLTEELGNYELRNAELDARIEDEMGDSAELLRQLRDRAEQAESARNAAQAKLAALCGLTVRVSPGGRKPEVWIDIPNASLNIGGYVDSQRHRSPVIAEAWMRWRASVLAAAQPGDGRKEDGDAVE